MYSCEYMKHRVYSCIIIYLLITALLIVIILTYFAHPGEPFPKILHRPGQCPMLQTLVSYSSHEDNSWETHSPLRIYGW